MKKTSAQVNPVKSTSMLFRPKKWYRWVHIISLGIFLIHLGVAMTIRSTDTGVALDNKQPVAYVIIGIFWTVIAECLLHFWVSVDKNGVIVRNFLPTRKTYTFDEIKGFVFPENKKWARIEIEHYEYIPLMAFSRVDKNFSVESLKKIKELVEKCNES